MVSPVVLWHEFGQDVTFWFLFLELVGTELVVVAVGRYLEVAELGGFRWEGDLGVGLDEACLPAHNNI